MVKDESGKSGKATFKFIHRMDIRVVKKCSCITKDRIAITLDQVSLDINYRTFIGNEIIYIYIYISRNLVEVFLSLSVKKLAATVLCRLISDIQIHDINRYLLTCSLVIY